MSLKCLINVNVFRVATSLEFLQHNSSSYYISTRLKHYNPKFKKLRAAKVIKIKLPDLEENKTSTENLSDEQIRSKYKEKGLMPEYDHTEKPIFISSTGDFFEPYVPPEGDGKVSKITKEGAKQTWEFVEKKGKSWLAIRKVRSFDEDFEIQDFLPVAQDIYLKTHETMANRDTETLLQYVTEKAYPEAINNIDRKTIHWKFLKSLEPPRVVHARCTDVITKDNIFGQITIRFHTQQVLAVYDRFGRLIHGSEILAKDVLEYVVFEKHLSNRYGVWRIHGKIIPDWKPLPEPGLKTYVVTKESDDDGSKELSTVNESKSEPQVETSISHPPSGSPQLAVA